MEASKCPKCGAVLYGVDGKPLAADGHCTCCGWPAKPTEINADTMRIMIKNYRRQLEQVRGEQTGCPELACVFSILNVMTDKEYAELVDRAKGNLRASPAVTVKAESAMGVHEMKETIRRMRSDLKTFIQMYLQEQPKGIFYQDWGSTCKRIMEISAEHVGMPKESIKVKAPELVEKKDRIPLFKGLRRLTKVNKTDMGGGWTTDPVFNLALSIDGDHCTSGVIDVDFQVYLAEEKDDDGTD